MEESKKRVEFRPPKGFMPPEGMGADKEWDMVCSFRSKPDGSICMTKLGDTAMPGYGDHDEHDEDREMEHKPGYDRMSSKLMADMGTGGMGNTTGTGMAAGY